MSKPIPKHYAVVEEGRLRIGDPKRWGDWLRKLKGKQVVITVEEIQDARGLNQLRYLWGVLYEAIAEHTGHEKEELHDFFKGKFLAHPISLGKEMVMAAGTTKTLSYEEMEEFTTNVRQWAAANLGVDVPGRGEVLIN